MTQEVRGKDFVDHVDLRRRNGTATQSSVTSFSDGDQLKQVISAQMNQAGNTLLCGLEPLTDAEFFAPGVNDVSPAWTVGHLACVFDLFTSWIVDCDCSLSKEAHAVFNPLEIRKKTVTKAESVDPARFPKSDILLMFRQMQVKALDILQKFDVSRWNDPTPPYAPDTLLTYGAIWQSLGVHTFWHLGELSGSIPRFHGTYTLNTVVHYFFTGARPAKIQG